MNSVLAEFSDKRVVVVGDLVADQFLTGTIGRVSREAPVFILRHDETETRPGAAANTASNIAALGGTALAVGIVGEDVNGDALIRSFPSGVTQDGILRVRDFHTTTKVRVLAGHHYAARQQVIRIDYENRAELSDEVHEALISHLRAVADAADAIVVSDYGYGVLTQDLFREAQLISSKRKIPLIVDSRTRLAQFAGATSATPNLEEVGQILGEKFTVGDCERLRHDLALEALLITRGNKGMLLLETDNEPLEISPFGSTEPVDVTGAGDTVIAAYALGLAAGLGFAESARIANRAGGIAVMKKGTATVSVAELGASLESEVTHVGSAASLSK